MMVNRRCVKKIAFIFLVIAALCISSVSPAHATGTYSQLSNFPVVHQNKTNWCWAACGEAILQYFGNTNVYQQDFVYYVKGGDLSNNPADFDEITSGLSHWNVSSTYTNSTYSFNNIETDIYNYQRPILIRWAWKNGDGSLADIGHVMIICGYNSYDASVFYMDPNSYQLEYDTYTYMVNATDHSWTHTMYSFS